MNEGRSAAMDSSALTADQQIRAWAALVVFGHGKLAVTTRDEPDRVNDALQDELWAVERYIREGLE